ncbi:MAG: RlmE family RNA methyltransferase [Thermodesulfobacteriota bacterium]
MRKVQDYYFHKAKKERYPARSVYKLDEVQTRYRLLSTGARVLDLGCQPGSWSLFAARTVGRSGQVVGVDRESGRPPDPGPEAAPVEALTCDVFDPDLVPRLAERCPQFDVILSDLGPRTTGRKDVDHFQSVRLASRALEVAAALLRPGGSLYCKVFQGEDLDSFVAAVRTRFTQVRIVKPKASRSESREVFVLGTGFVKED